ncbi:sensor histidine kinase [Kitasatospora sp. NPDC048365]|uniref:sensor histidine kinase n=1 Tax=Kitasatospora sp. NPDC048365 TaxID=3364050 RepID=UPI0037230520
MSALIGRRAALRWVHLVLGGALLMPYWMLAVVVLTPLVPGDGPRRAVLLDLAALPLALPAAAVTALVPVVRVLESAAARALCAGAGGELATVVDRCWAARRRTALWFVLHLGLGGVVAGMSLAVPPAVVVLLVRPDDERLRLWFGPHPPAPALLAAALTALVVLTSAGAGALLARCAPPLLGPTPAERIAEAERRTLVLAQRNRLAGELHDSIGHALSAVAIQAAAAGRVLERDPAFAAEALAAIERTARDAVGELDAVLGLLREEQDGGGVGPVLGGGGLELLLRQVGLAGLRVRARTGPGLDALAPELSREAYRIVQEGLSNVLRHAGAGEAELRIERRGERLELELTNPLGTGRPSRPGGGRGLRGLAERAAALRGEFTAGPDADGTGWRLAAVLPTGGAA